MALSQRVAVSAVALRGIWPYGRLQYLRCAAQRVSRLQPQESKPLQPAFVPARWHSAPASKSRVYDFNEIKQISASHSPDRILIDVREPSEFRDGYIPGAINIPIKSQPDALFLPEEEFEDRFGFSKPETNKEVVFYCKSGVRSSAAAQLAQRHGYQNVAEYRGSWLDWQKQGGTEARP